MNKVSFKILNYKSYLFMFICVGIIALVSQDVAAAGLDLGSVASSIRDSFASTGKLITASSYIAGLAFSIGAIMKFKAHKDNPTQVPVGTPIALVFIAAALLFLPTILDMAGYTMFGTSGGTPASSEGMEYKAGSGS